MDNAEVKEYELLGSAVNITANDKAEMAKEIVDLVRQDAEELRTLKPYASNNDIAVSTLR